jgi:hypothetical protein
MARPDVGIVRQLHQAADGFPQSRAVAASEIGTAAVADKQGVARKKISLCIQTDAAGGMAGRMYDIKGYLTQLPYIFIDYEDIRIGVSIGIKRMDDNFRPVRDFNLALPAVWSP